jgi:hypothetical protein
MVGGSVEKLGEDGQSNDTGGASRNELCSNPPSLASSIYPCELSTSSQGSGKRGELWESVWLVSSREPIGYFPERVIVFRDFNPLLWPRKSCMDQLTF